MRPIISEISIPIMKKVFLFCIVLLLNSLLAEGQKGHLTGEAKKTATLYTQDADYLFEEGNYYAALPIYLKLIKLDSTEEYYWFQAGICYIYTDEKEKSIEF